MEGEAEADHRDDEGHGGEIDREGIEMWSDSAIKRLDHVWETLETAAGHASDQATIDALAQARDTIESAQADVREIEEEMNR